jgi:predicted nucleic-acid-binding Zn-ribbon protein
MKWFRCPKCGFVDTAKTQIEITACLRLEDIQKEPYGALIYDDYEYIQNPRALQCVICGSTVAVVEKPCHHDWGRIEWGYGGNKGQARQQCQRCGEYRYGKGKSPAWESA